MTTPIISNVIKISQNGTIDSPISIPNLYPRTCDFCRDTYNSELTFKRHKETGKCFRFCRLREEIPVEYRKSIKPSMYPRICERCLKTYKNKHSYYKHKNRCWNTKRVPTPPPIASNQAPVTPDIDVVELSKDDIENIPITDNKENINDFDSKFILALDVDEDFENYSSLYPRICEYCHKAFKCKTSFSNHRIKGRCSTGKRTALSRISPLIHRCEKCKKPFRMKSHFVAHTKLCGKPQLSVVSQLQKINDFKPLPGTSVQIVEPTTFNGLMKSAELVEQIAVPIPDKSLYPRECKRCQKTYSRKQSFYRHKKWCFPELGKKARIMYPRTCEFCGFIFTNKSVFQRHKHKCPGYTNQFKIEFDKAGSKCQYCSETLENVFQYRQHVQFAHPSVPLYRAKKRAYQNLYPRSCAKCGNTYLSRQTYCNHKRRCGPAETIPTPVPEGEKTPYPRTCATCSRSYCNRQSFWNHKKWCRSANDTENEESDGKISIYPRECEFCHEIYSDKRAFYRHKPGCEGYKNEIPKDRASLYPRICELCHRVYATRQSFYSHNLTCTGQMAALLKMEIQNDDSAEFTDHTDEWPDTSFKTDWQEATIKTETPKSKITYPRMCAFCRKIYANRQTFHKHKARCIPVPPIEEIIEPDPLAEQFTYPRECTNCLGTFKCPETFDAHKIKCDFFEPIDDSDVKMITQSNCEHCRNILSQYRRIFQQHLDQCADPVILRREKLLQLQHDHEHTPSVLHQSLGKTKKMEDTTLVSDATEFVDCTDNFCECCGVFFDSIEQLEFHKQSMEQAAENSMGEVDVIISDLNPHICDICQEVLGNEEEYDTHRLKCIMNSSNKTYPRFCECCKKIYKTKQSFYNHKKNCHVYCFKYFVQKDCEVCSLPFKCEIMFLEHQRICVRIDNGEVGAECEVLAGQ